MAAEVDILRAAVPVPFAGTVTGTVPGVKPLPVLKLQVLPAGSPVQERDTVPANPFTEVTVTVELAACPGATLAEELDKLKLKS